MIRLIAAIDTKQGIANESGIPWKLPGDTAYFHEKTTSGLILMSWATYWEFAAPLHGRDNFVLTDGKDSLRAGFVATGSLDEIRAAHPGEFGSRGFGGAPTQGHDRPRRFVDEPLWGIDSRRFQRGTPRGGRRRGQLARWVARSGSVIPALWAGG